MERRIEQTPWAIPASYRSGWFFAFGAMLIALGALAVLLPFAASFTTILVIGWILLVGGVVQLVHSVQHHAAPGLGWSLLNAVFRLAAGVLIIARPMTGKLVVTAILATYFLVMGVADLAQGIDARGAPHRGWVIFNGVVSLVLGILVWAGFPASATWIIGLFVGIELISAGFAVVSLGMTISSRRRALTV